MGSSRLPVTVVSDEELNLTFHSGLEILRSVRGVVKTAAQKLGLSEEAIYDIQLAVHEAVANIIEHGYAGASDGLIEMHLRDDGDGALVVELCDSGMACDVKNIRLRSLDELQESGMGLHIINNLVDDIEYKRTPDGKNHLILTKKNGNWIKREDTMEHTALQQDGVVVLTPAGELDVNNVDSLRDLIEGEIAKGTRKLVVDLADVSYMDSAALGTLVSGLKKARQKNVQFKVANLQDPVERIFNLTRLSKFFEIYSSTEEAVNSFQHR